ncbi:MAG: glycosyltransferase family 2 protein [Clostridium sp.]|nr:glycosyltransferase family 2 protein [Clostridium sp.]
MSDSKVSIIMPVFNAEKFLEKSIESLIKQTYRNIEVLCIDDGSSDSSLAILNTFAQKDSRIKVFSQENSGPAFSRNKGLDNSSGDYIMFCDADDWYEDNMVELMVNTIEKKDVDFVICDVNIILSKFHNRPLSDIEYHFLNFSGFIDLNNCMKIQDKVRVFLWKKIFRKNIIDEYNIRFPNGLKSDDCVFIREYVYVSNNCYALDKKLYNHVIQKDSIMGKVFAKKSKDYFDFIKGNIQLADFVNKVGLKNKNKLNYILHSVQNEAFFWMQFIDEKKELNEYFVYLIQFAEKFDISLIDKAELPLIYAAKNRDIKTLKNLCEGNNSRKNTIFENVFSIRNMVDRNKSFKVITILGIKIKKLIRTK